MTSVDDGRQGRLRIGTKQTKKAILQGKALEVLVAQDADPRIVARVVQLAEQKGVKLTYVDTMRNLGRTCGIEVGAAMAAMVEE
jgi:large subunit ribosomal protein L7A